MLAKILLPFAALFIFFISCSRESTEPLWEPKTHLSQTAYNGGLFPIWITLKEPLAEKDSAKIEWKRGRHTQIAYRIKAIDTAKKLIFADTAFFFWDETPPAFLKIDSTQIKQDSITSWKMDTTYYYRDTIYAIVNGLASEPIIIEVKNILPRITSLTVGGVSQPGDSVLTIAANPGDRLEISIRLKDPFNDAFSPKIEMPKELGSKLKTISYSDSLFVYEWSVPTDTIANNGLYIRVTDSGGRGERLYKVNLVVYTEYGSFWVAAEKELVKYSSAGAEVARIRDGFSSISDIAINSKNERLYVTDQAGNSFSIYDAYGKKLYSNNNTFKSPTGVAVDVEGNYAWVADAKDELSPVMVARLQRFALIGDSLQFANVGYEMSGPVKGLSVDQFQRDFVWFTIPKSDSVGFIRSPNLDNEPKYLSNSWKRPSMVSLDQISGAAWIVDSSRVTAIDTAGNVLAIIKGFEFVSSISASKGDVWVSDIAGKVYRFKGAFTGKQYDLNLTVLQGMETKKGFLSPISVSAFIADGSVWVVDKGAGQAIHLDSSGNIKASGTGLKLPILGKTIQKVD
jgi:hypothetical protein